MSPKIQIATVHEQVQKGCQKFTSIIFHLLADDGLTRLEYISCEESIPLTLTFAENLSLSLSPQVRALAISGTQTCSVLLSGSS